MTKEEILNDMNCIINNGYSYEFVSNEYEIYKLVENYKNGKYNDLTIKYDSYISYTSGKWYHMYSTLFLFFSSEEQDEWTSRQFKTIRYRSFLGDSYYTKTPEYCIRHLDVPKYLHDNLELIDDEYYKDNYKDCEYESIYARHTATGYNKINRTIQDLIDNENKKVIEEENAVKIKEIELKRIKICNHMNHQKVLFYRQYRKIQINNKKEIDNNKKAYLMLDENTGFIKIGNSIKPSSREKTLRSDKPTITLFHVFTENHEKILHKRYAKHRFRGEWFKLSHHQIKHIISHYK